ncbi:MAG: hypothetical protein HUJ69_05100 [Lachnospiraceae bacterium]|nr:hypothetical protein [Lachnospiraceae bacterium]
MNIRYFAGRVLKNLSGDKINGYVQHVRDINGKSKAFILADMLWCALIYGAGFNDYIIFEFYNIGARDRRTYMTRLKNRRFLDAMNDKTRVGIFDDKNQFYHHFGPFLKREFLDLALVDDDQLIAFVRNKEYIVAKPNDGECGEGIEKIRTDRFDSPETLATYLRDPAKNFGVVEELLVQHPEMSRLYPESVNCLRLCTLVTEGKGKCLYAVLKTGNNGKFVDNLENGGYACHVDMETGVVIGPGHTNRQDKVEAHPATGVAFRGFRIPYFKEAVALAEAAALVVPDMRYVGWDICILEDGPAIIEGNNYTAYDFPQMPDDSVPTTGLVKIIEDAGVKVR